MKSVDDLTPYLDKKVEVQLIHEDENGPIVYRGYLGPVVALPGMFAVTVYHDPEPDDRSHYCFRPFEVETIAVIPS